MDEHLFQLAFCQTEVVARKIQKALTLNPNLANRFDRIFLLIFFLSYLSDYIKIISRFTSAKNLQLNQLNKKQ